MSAARRRARAADAAAMAALMDAGLATYRAFAPAGWDPTPEPPERIAARLQRPGAWGILIERPGGELVAFGAYEPARDAPGAADGPAIDGLAHVWALFVDPERHGDGSAVAVHAALMRHIHDRGFREARLYTPAGHARALRFYEREGWAVGGEPFPVAEIGLDLVELRRAV